MFPSSPPFGVFVDSRYSRPASASSTTLQACFLECQEDSKCHNVFVPYIDIVWMEKPPSVNCTLLGVLADPSTGCVPGTGTLVNKLPGARECAHLWEESESHHAVTPMTAQLRANANANATSASTYDRCSRP